jgi:DNA-binding transcriptional ArsR family regulator
MPEELPLEPDLIEVLAADTRRNVLSLLQDRRMTVTELARELDLGKATVHEHLDKLTEAGLVERHEDDRLWVYYGLTPRGKRLLNPDRTRFYLALASSVVAALIAGLAVYAFVMTGGFTGAPADGDTTMLTPTQDEVYTGKAVEVPAEAEGEDAEQVSAYLVDEGGAERLRQGDYDVQGLPLRAYAPGGAEAGDVEARDDTTLLRSDAALEPGTYYLYVRGSQGDNAEAMPAIRLVGLDASPDRGTWFQRLDAGPVTIDVTREGEPLAGQLRLAGPQGTGPAVPLEDGTARLSASTMDRLPPGQYEITVQPEDRARWIATQASLRVQPSPLTALPLHVADHQPRPVDLRLDGPDRLTEDEPLVQGSRADVDATSTGWRILLEDPQPAPVTLQLAREQETVHVHPRVAIEATVQDGPELRWNLTHGEEPLAEAALYVDGRARGFTDANGTLVTDLLDEGPHRVTVHRPDGETVTRSIAVDGWRLSQQRPSLTVDPVNVTSTDASAEIQVLVDNGLDVRQPATLVAALDGEPVASQALEVPAGGEVTTNLTVPADLGRQQVTVHADPLDPGPFDFANETREADGGDASDGGEDAGAESTESEAHDDGTTATVGSSSQDTDGDGVPDAEDACPQAAGTEANDGCPQEDAADGAHDGEGVTGDAASSTTGKLEPVRPREAGAESADSEQTPGLPLAALLTLAGLAAALARHRKP